MNLYQSYMKKEKSCSCTCMSASVMSQSKLEKQPEFLKGTANSSVTRSQTDTAAFHLINRKLKAEI